MSDTKKTTYCPKCGAVLAADAPEGLCPRCLLALNLAHPTEAGNAGPTSAKPPPAPSEIAPHFPQLEILECLGRGGMGAVYKARQKRIDRLVALKILAPERQGDAQFTERFQREARALARLNHPNIVTVHDFGEAGGYCYLLMEFVEGVTLRQLMQQRKLSPAEALAIVPKICDALQFAHTKGIVHRDIKPENILLATHGEVKIADFGIAKLVEHGGTELTLTGAQEVVGTPHYMAPEQAEKPGTVDHRADIFSLGVVIYEMLTSELPLGKFPPPSRKVQVDLRLDEIVLRTLEKEPELRYQHVSQVKTDLETVACDTTSSVRKPATPHPSIAGRSVAATQWVILTAILLVVGGAVWLWKTRIPPSAKPAGCVAWWRAEGDAKDSVSNNHGIAVFGVGFAPGRVGQAFDFSGHLQRVSIPDDQIFIPTEALTVEAWVLPRQYGGFIIVRGDNRPGYDCWNLSAPEPGLVYFVVYDDHNNCEIVKGPLQLGRWQHVAGTWERATGVMKLYIDGQLASERQIALTPASHLDGASEPAIGIGNAGGTRHEIPFNGLIDEPAIYTRALSSEEIGGICKANKRDSTTAAK